MAQKKWQVVIAEDGVILKWQHVRGSANALKLAREYIKEHATNWSDFGIRPATVTLSYVPTTGKTIPIKLWVATCALKPKGLLQFTEVCPRTYRDMKTVRQLQAAQKLVDSVNLELSKLKATFMWTNRRMGSTTLVWTCDGQNWYQGHELETMLRRSLSENKNEHPKS